MSEMTLEEVRAAERERIASILRDPVSRDRKQAAEALAFDSEMSAADAVSLLATLDAAAPKPTATGPRSADALNGLVTLDANGEPTLDGPAVQSSPAQATAETPAKRLWKSAVAGVSATGAKQAEAG